ncbi:MAG TPA: hypothetical protein VMI33_06055 [Streptosporangiaceae bacterium]|nr:hypothetical protein [Streptosporangiaceae bacterium]
MLHRHRVFGLADNGRAAVLSAGTALVMMSAVGIGAASCTGSVSYAPRAAPRFSARTRQPASAVSVLAGAPDVLAADVAQVLFATAPVVVLAAPGRPAGLAAAAADAVREHAPLLLTSAPAPVSGTLRAQIHALHPRALLAVGIAKGALAGQLPGIRVVTDLAKLPATKAPAPLDHVVLLVRRGDSGAGTAAAVTTARVAGAQVIGVSGGDPQTDPAAIAELSAARPRQVIAVGARFAPAGELASRLAVAETGVQLPGGGQVLFPRHRLVALYGHPGTPSLGALGQQGLRASIARARMLAARYRPLSTVPVIPAFEIIATVAEASPGPDGDYSYQTPVALLRPWVRRAIAAGMYVILDLQAGRASLLAQAKVYQSLLRLPDVGLALDPEWKLQPGQRPLRQIGSVSSIEVNGVIRWLAGLTARYRLPQKVLVLHQFKLSMIQGEQRLDTRYGDLAIVIHMDGQGTPADKEQTWAAVTAAAPAGVFFGWKNFFTKDHPMMSPGQTMARTPQPVMISYQ